MEFITSATHRAIDFFKRTFKSMTEMRTEHTLVFVWAPSYFLIVIKVLKDQYFGICDDYFRFSSESILFHQNTATFIYLECRWELLY